MIALTCASFVTDADDGGRLIIRDSGRRVVTPLLVVFITIGGPNMLFALDSMLAVFGVTREAYLVFATNAFALLGLRALNFLVTGLLDRLVYLSAGLAVILFFIGTKLILHWAHGLSQAISETSTVLPLEVVAVMLAITTTASLIRSRRSPSARVHARAVLGTPDRKGHHCGRERRKGVMRRDAPAEGTCLPGKNAVVVVWRSSRRGSR
jgi:tellurite resistance protein TerC